MPNPATIHRPHPASITAVSHDETRCTCPADWPVGTPIVCYARPVNGHSSDVTAGVVVSPSVVLVAHAWRGVGCRVWLRQTSRDGQQVNA